MTLRGASVVRSGQRLLDRVDLTVAKGEAVVIRGHNGAGKTTLLRVLAGLMHISEGEAEVLGEATPLTSTIRRRVSASLDDPAFWPWMSARSVIRTVADLSGHPRPDTSALLEEIGLDDARFALRRSKRVGHFSQGMRKRLQIACVLALPSDLLLVDEPTANLDSEGVELVCRALVRRRDQGATVIVATHDEEPAHRLGGRSVTLDRGRVVDDVPATLVQHV